MEKENAACRPVASRRGGKTKSKRINIDLIIAQHDAVWTGMADFRNARAKMAMETKDIYLLVMTLYAKRVTIKWLHVAGTLPTMLEQALASGSKAGEQ